VDLEGLFSRYGYLVLLLGSLADGTPVMLFGGFAAHRGWLVLVPSVVLAGACGNFLACAAWFFAARALGERILEKRPGWAKPVARMRARVERWQTPSVLAIRFVPGLAGAGFVAIALAGVPPGRFLALNAVGALIWAAVLGTLGYLLGNTVELLLGEIERYEQPVALTLLVATVAWIAYSRWRRRRHPAAESTAAGSPP
jgi:membrane protein DedA with SNARE-associated domain